VAAELGRHSGLDQRRTGLTVDEWHAARWSRVGVVDVCGVFRGLHGMPAAWWEGFREVGVRLRVGWSVVVIVEGVAEGVAADLVTEGEAGFVVEAAVEAGVDPAEAGLRRGGGEAVEGPGDAGEGRRGDGE